ncbi:MAG TPA: MotA/TolQ/ExbB proton channel family protein [Novosphingobium sp.]|nr:MotA/TolQ/ExbB proton channel family protein [Novosphingobium sp.]
MLFEILAAGANSAPQNKFGFMEALQQGGLIAQTTVCIMAIFSFGSFFILFTRYADQAKIFNQYKALGNFWKANSLREGVAKLDKQSPFRDIVEAGLQAEDQHAKMTDALEAHDWLHGSLSRAESSVTAFLARGLPFLATVGSTAPFVGLFGTVVGIYRALIAIGIAGSASIDKVAGPVGEALIMTAIGLLVAVPAVLAYNFLQARNKRINELLSGFSNDVLANINSKGAIKPAVPAAAAKPAAAPAAKPAAK